MMKKITLLLAISFILFANLIFAQVNPTISNEPISPEAIQKAIDNYQSKVVTSNITNHGVYKAPEGNRFTYQTNLGKDFWLTFMPNATVIPELYLDLSSSVNTTGTVSVSGISFTEDFTITANTVTRITIPATAMMTISETVTQMGIHIVSVDDIAVYGTNLYNTSSDAFLGIPVTALGTSYIMLGYQGLPVYGSDFAIVSPSDGNVVTITPSVLTSDGHAADVPFDVTLNQGEVYLVVAEGDITGSVVSSTYPVAVFAGSVAANIPVNTSAADVLVEQMPPVSAWGTDFIGRPLAGRANGDTWRFLASQDATSLTINGTNVATLNKGDFYETILTEASLISADKPILTIQYANGIGWDNLTGDPFSMLIPPYGQFTENYTFSTPSSGFDVNYINVFVKTTGVSGMLLDGVSMDPTEFVVITGTEFSAAAFPTTINTTYNITNSNNEKFGLTAYGFTGSNSYGYPGGSGYEVINTEQATNIIESNHQGTQVDLEWTRGNGENCVAFVFEGTSGIANAENGVTYTANANFGDGSQIGTTGWYCVYNGTGNNVSLTGLTEGITYRVMVLEYDGVSGAESYLLEEVFRNPLNVEEPQDPNCNIGNENVTNGFEQAEFTNNYLLGVKYTLSETGTLNSINMIGTGLGEGLQMAVYDDNSGVPNNLIIASGLGTVGDGLTTFQVSSTVLPAGDYWVMACYEITETSSYERNAPGNLIYYSDHPYGTTVPSNASDFIYYDGLDFPYFLGIDCGVDVSIEDFNISNNVLISPNPSSDNIKLIGLSDTQEYKIYNNFGQEVDAGIVSNDSSIDIKSLPNGFYILKLEKGSIQKFIKK